MGVGREGVGEERAKRVYDRGQGIVLADNPTGGTNVTGAGREREESQLSRDVGVPVQDLGTTGRVGYDAERPTLGQKSSYERLQSTDERKGGEEGLIEKEEERMRQAEEVGSRKEEGPLKAMGRKLGMTT